MLAGRHANHLGSQPEPARRPFHVLGQRTRGWLGRIDEYRATLTAAGSNSRDLDWPGREKYNCNGNGVSD